jgi:hypothetical protein
VLAEEAGVLLGLAPSRPLPEETVRFEPMAALLIEAGADKTVVVRWAEDVQAARAVRHTSNM